MKGVETEGYESVKGRVFSEVGASRRVAWVKKIGRTEGGREGDSLLSLSLSSLFLARMVNFRNFLYGTTARIRLVRSSLNLHVKPPRDLQSAEFLRSQASETQVSNSCTLHAALQWVSSLSTTGKRRPRTTT